MGVCGVEKGGKGRSLVINTTYDRGLQESEFKNQSPFPDYAFMSCNRMRGKRRWVPGNNRKFEAGLP